MKLKKRARETFFSRGIRLGEMGVLYHFIFFGVGRKSHRRGSIGLGRRGITNITGACLYLNPIRCYLVITIFGKPISHSIG